ncbi:MAG: glycoside hydrolase family 25 protein [Bacillota bacterium]|nr:glycoside hydrolase family 25 protein [Bacillota bacterium]
MKIIKRTSIWLVAVIACLSMTLSPAILGSEAFAVETDDSEDLYASEVVNDELYERIDGKYVDELQGDEEISILMDDPSFLRYFDIDEDTGLVTRKVTSTDEIDEFIRDMDDNADGIDDDTLTAMTADMTAVGCGVSGLGKAEVPKKYKDYKKYHCVDISYWQKKVTDSNWQKIKKAGVTHVILRVGYSALSSGKHNSDSVFAYNIEGAYRAGMKIGIYYYSTAVNSDEAKSEAEYTIGLLKKYKHMITLPVAYDYETGGRLTSKVMKKYGTDSCIAFCDRIAKAGYKPMVYANYSTLKNYIDYQTLQKKYPIWLAHYTTKGVATDYPGEYAMWQYSSSGSVNGLPGRIDINYFFEKGNGNTETSNSSETAESKPLKLSYYGVTKCKLNYRTGPGTDYKKVGTYSKKAVVKVAKKSNGWALLTNGYYVKADKLTKYSSYKVVVKSKLNYRTGPGTNYKKKGTYKKGKELTALYKSGSWTRLANGYYVKTKWIKKK